MNQPRAVSKLVVLSAVLAVSSGVLLFLFGILAFWWHFLYAGMLVGATAALTPKPLFFWPSFVGSWSLVILYFLDATEAYR